MIPTITQMVKVYVDAAEVERMKCGRPCKSTVRNTLLGVKRFRIWLNERRERLGYETVGFDEDFPLVSIVKPPLIHRYLSEMLRKGTLPLTAMSYLNHFQQLFAKWVRPYYEDRGWKIPPFPSLGGRPKAPRYNRPSSDQLAKVKEWYTALTDASFGGKMQGEDSVALANRRNLWFATTMMLEFAMRNSDIMRLTKRNFVESSGRLYLNYMPNKTAHSSARVVKWPVHPRLRSMIEENEFDCDAETFACLNREMRALGFSGTKGAYELRKICIDHIYQKYGVEMAVSISGDNIKTILHYYADPAQPNIEDVRVVDLL